MNRYHLFDSLIHLQDSQTINDAVATAASFDSLIHLQDSQTWRDSNTCKSRFDSLIHLQDSQTGDTVCQK